jgi:hypothetical protein
LTSRAESATCVYAYATVGVFLLVVPWTALWGQAVAALAPAGARAWLLSGWVRGAVSGLGAFDLVFAAQVALELRRRNDRSSDRHGPV